MPGAAGVLAPGVRARSPDPVILVLDNRDSFTFNLVQALESLGAQVEVVRAERASGEGLLARRPERVVVGPGPGGPARARASLELFATSTELPILGVCLGHQCLGFACGASIVPARRLLHGSPVSVSHTGTGLFEGIPSPTPFMRYHSLSVAGEGLPECLEVLATSDEGDVMALRHRNRPWLGVQFHPESFLSEHGSRLLANFLALAS